MDMNGALMVVDKHVRKKTGVARYRCFRSTVKGALESLRTNPSRDDQLLVQGAMYHDTSLARLAFPYEQEIAFHPQSTIIRTVQTALHIPEDTLNITRFVAKGRSGKVFEAVDSRSGETVIIKAVCLRSCGNQVHKGDEAAIDSPRHEAYEIQSFITEAYLQDKANAAMRGARAPAIFMDTLDVVRMHNNGKVVWTYGVIVMEKVEGVLCALLKNQYESMTNIVRSNVATIEHKREVYLTYHRFIMHVATRLKDLVESLAANNFVHGDFHPGNIAFSKFDMEDFLSTISKLPEFPGLQPVWYISKPGYWNSMVRLMAAQGGTTWEKTADGQMSAMFLGYPVEYVHVMPTALGDTVSTILAYFGDLAMAAMLGNRRGLTIQLSDQRYFEFDQMGIRGTSRVNVVIAQPGDASNAGPIVALKTPGA
jgi:hypothetical protein